MRTFSSPPLPAASNPQASKSPPPAMASPLSAPPAKSNPTSSSSTSASPPATASSSCNAYKCSSTPASFPLSSSVPAPPSAIAMPLSKPAQSPTTKSPSTWRSSSKPSTRPWVSPSPIPRRHHHRLPQPNLDSTRLRQAEELRLTPSSLSS